MRCKVREIPLFRGKYRYKKETVTDTFVSITVSVMAKVPQVDTMHSLVWGVHYPFLNTNPGTIGTERIPHCRYGVHKEVYLYCLKGLQGVFVIKGK